MLPALLLPLLALTALGWLLAKTRFLPAGWQDGLTGLTAKLFIPAFLFGGAFRNGIPDAVSWTFLAAFFLPLLLLFMAACALRRDAGRGPRALAATYSNTVFVGIPVLMQAFGPESLRYAFPVIAFHGLAAFTLYYTASPHAGRKGDLLWPVASALRNPIVLSLMLGLFFNAVGAELPKAAADVLGMLAAAALPCALLALGASLAVFRIRSWPETIGIVCAKLFVLPACVLGMAVYVFGVPAPAAAVLVVIAACPVGVNAAALVQADGKDPALVSSAILLSSLACIGTIPLWVWIVSKL